MSARLTARRAREAFETSPFSSTGPGQPSGWHGRYVSADGTTAGVFSAEDVAEILYNGDTGSDWDGNCVGVMRLRDGRLVAFETNWGPTGDGFHEDAYGGDADLVFASDLRLIVNTALTDAGRRLAGVPAELWNGPVSS